MLLQIEEPEDTVTPRKKFCVVGIDLGTTNSVMAYVKEGRPETITLKGCRLMPSCVSFDEAGKICVGQAKNSATSQDIRNFSKEQEKSPCGTCTFSSIKRHFDAPHRPFSGTTHTPVTLSACILITMKEEAERQLGCRIEGAVITVPAYFDEPARQATKEAATLAGIRVLRLINEPTAAAVAYHLEYKNEGLYLIYDLGGGTFDVSLLRLEDGIFQVLGVGGDTKLGGDDVDQKIVDYLAYEKNIHLNLMQARQIKENIHIDEKYNNILTPEELRIFAAPLIERTLDMCASVLRDASVSIHDLQGVVLVGGSTRLLGLKEQLTTFFKQEVLDNINPDEVVAHGAALQAHGLTYGSDRLLLDVTPLSLGVETLGGLMERIIVRNTPLPCRLAQDFTTAIDGQTKMSIHILQGESDEVSACRSLGTFILEDIPHLPAHTAKIRVTFAMDVDGLLTVEAKELSSGTAQHISVHCVSNS